MPEPFAAPVRADLSMAYQVLARKRRPQEFGELIGQEAVVTALVHALRDGKIAQAYLFSGIRGVGKTTAARVFAKALNCEAEPDRRPCGQCGPCTEIVAGADLDVLEIDAATYSKVEQVRELAESLKYGPARDRHKVVILDEVHRLSRQAFDALLKIVEEPPPRLVFIFATTEIDAVPATILSRCQEYQFRRVPAAVVVAHLKKICADEKITATDRALHLLARAGEGSVRDSVALLDQLATAGQGAVDNEQAARLLGGLDLGRFAALLEAILAGESATVSAAAREVEAAGWDPRQAYSRFLGYVRDGLHLALGGDGAGLDLPAEDAQALAEIARRAGYESLLRLLHQMLGSEQVVRRSDAAALALELAWLRAAELPKLISIERALAGAAPAAPPAAPPTRSAPAADPGPATSRTAAAVAAGEPPPEPPATAPQPLAPDPRAQYPPAQHPPDTAAPESAPRAPRPAAAPGSALERFHEELAVRRPILAAQISQATCELVGGELRIALPASEPFASSQLARPANRELLDAAVVAAFGAGTRWRLVDGPAAAPTAAQSAAAGERARKTRAELEVATADPRVQAVLEIFGGGVSGIDDNGAEAEENG